MRTVKGGLVGLIATLIAMPVQGQDIEVRVTGRVQVQYNTTAVGEDDLAPDEAIASSTFETRRVRLGVRLRIDDWITGSLEPEYALGRLVLRQVWMNLGIDPAFEIRIGQFKKPFSLIQLTSSLETATIERGMRIREIFQAYARADSASSGGVLGRWLGLPVLGEEQELLALFGYMGYALGATAHGRLGPIEYDVGVFNGAGPDLRDTNDGKSFAGRVVWRSGGSLPIGVGAGITYEELTVPASVPQSDGTAYEIDFELGEFRRRGFHLQAEAVTGTNMAVDESFVAGQAVLSYFKPTRGDRIEGLEPVVRLSWGDPNREVTGDAGMLFTPGINMYFLGRNRLQLNWDVFVPQGDSFETYYALRAQAQMAF